MSKVKLNKVEIQVESPVKVDNRVNNTGRPVNKKSARQVRLAKQRLYARLNMRFVSGQNFKINNDNGGVYYYVASTVGGYISNGVTHVCNVNYVGRTKVLGYTYVMGRKININVNLKNVKFVK